MIPTKGYAAHRAKEPLKPFQFERRDVGPSDVLIQIAFCGICHSDIHQARDEWDNGLFPMVPGHEIVGKVAKVGSKVSRFKTGDWVGVGCLVNSCRNCTECKEGLEQFCSVGSVGTYNSREKDGTPTHGGYSQQIVVDHDFVLKVPANLKPEGVAPLLCAGITTYSPLKHWKVGKGSKVGIVGIGGLGHMGVKIARAMGAEVTVFTTSPSKKEDALRLGAQHVILSKNASEMEKAAGTLHFMIDTISAPHDIRPYLNALKRDGSLVLVGVPEDPLEVDSFYLINGRKSVAGSLIGGIAETQEMLDFCGKHGLTADVEVIPFQKVNEAYDRAVAGNVKYRFVLDTSTL